MARYLIVTHQTARSPELQQKVADLIAADADAEFAILVPETSTSDTSWEGDHIDIAKQRAEAAESQLRQNTGAHVVRTTAGVADPLKAIEAELVGHQDYDTLVICTLPLGRSRWLRRDVIHHAERRFGLPVIHVVAHASA
jgi:hypothetical protein